MSAYRRTLGRLSVALIVVLAWSLGEVLAGSLPSTPTESPALQKRFCTGPGAKGNLAFCARLKTSGRSGPFVPAGGRLSYASRRPVEGSISRLASLGISVSEITSGLAARYRVTQSIAGVVVIDIVTGGLAERAGLVAGDVLVEVDQDPIENPGDLASRIEALAKSNADTALVLIYRNYQHRFQVITIN